MSNLRNRPFLFVFHTIVPGVTELQDAVETITIADRVSDKHLAFASFVIDILDKKVIKNRYGTDDDQTVDSYIDRYNKEIKIAVDRWIKENSGSKERIRKIAKDLGIEIPEVSDSED